MNVLDNFYTDHPFVDLLQTTKDERTFLAFFKKDRFLELMIIINFVNIASHKYVVQKS